MFNNTTNIICISKQSVVQTLELQDEMLCNTKTLTLTISKQSTFQLLSPLKCHLHFLSTLLGTRCCISPNTPHMCSSSSNPSKGITHVITKTKLIPTRNRHGCLGWLLVPFFKTVSLIFPTFHKCCQLRQSSIKHRRCLFSRTCYFVVLFEA